MMKVQISDSYAIIKTENGGKYVRSIQPQSRREKMAANLGR